MRMSFESDSISQTYNASVNLRPNKSVTRQLSKSYKHYRVSSPALRRCTSTQKHLPIPINEPRLLHDHDIEPSTNDIVPRPNEMAS